MTSPLTISDSWRLLRALALAAENASGARQLALRRQARAVWRKLKPVVTAAQRAGVPQVVSQYSASVGGSWPAPRGGANTAANQ